MKELSIEEKAKAYDKLIKRLNKAREDVGGYTFKSVYNAVMSELKESEDEKIKNDIINYLALFKSQIGKDYDSWIAWLEKQGEQKPAGKIEPKFKVGDWFVNNINKDIFLIKSINNGYYTLEDIKGNIISPCLPPCESESHLWTIKDVKAGDVLCTYECDEPKIVFILKGTPKKHYALSYHCYYNIMYPHFASDSEKGCLAPNDEDVKPATKEQRDLLFQKMHEADYEWDAEKKELNKIHNALEECEIENIEHGKYYYCIKDYFAGGKKQASKGDVVQALRGLPIMALGVKANEYFLPVNSIKQRHAWSEEDEMMIKFALTYFRKAGATEDSNIIRWLKSLKPQPKQGWNEEDKNMLQSILDEYKSMPTEKRNWLKSLRNRYTWKPSDEQIEALESATENCAYSEYRDCLREMIEQLKKLREELV